MAATRYPTQLVTSNGMHDGVRRIALFCSSRCPGTVVVRALDIASVLAQTETEVRSGFHSPVEREVLRFLLCGSVKLVVCPARSGVGMRIPIAWRPAIAAGRLMIRSAIDEGFDAQHHSTRPGQAPRCPTTALAEQRNQFVASISDAALILHASPGGKLDRLADELLAAGKPLWTLDDPSNRSLILRGARSLTPETVSQIWAA